GWRRPAPGRGAPRPRAYRGLAPALTALARLEEAEAATRYLRRIEPQSLQSWVTTAAVATRLMRQEAALQAYERAAQIKPGDVWLRLSIGHVHKTLGHRADSESAYHEALRLEPGFGEAWWSL